MHAKLLRCNAKQQIYPRHRGRAQMLGRSHAGSLTVGLRAGEGHKMVTSRPDEEGATAAFDGRGSGCRDALSVPVESAGREPLAT